MRTALITIAHGRHDHLRGQRAAVARLRTPPAISIVVAMDDPELATAAGSDVSVVSVPGTSAGLPLAAARNAGAEAALAAGAELLIFLDVDCLPSSLMINYYVAAAVRPAGQSALLCGPVAYLPPPPPTGYDLDQLGDHSFHPARPAPAAGTMITAGDHRLFWSLSFALTAATWRRIGGFHPGYVGYGGEDTDFAMLAAQQGIELAWVGGAAAYHQWHPTTSPPVQHLDDILRNGALFARRWGWWPMDGWLSEFAARGLVASDGAGGWLRTARSVAAASVPERAGN